MKQTLFSFLLVLASGICVSQDLPGFLESPRFNRPGTQQFINDQVDDIQLTSAKLTEDYVAAADPFALVDGKEVVTWGRGKELPGIFFDEDLTSIFTRELWFDSFDFDEGLFEWVFTGDKAGFNVSVSSDTIWCFQRYYDSYGFNEVQGPIISLNRHPETIWLIHAIPYTGYIQCLSVSVDHRMVLQVHVNGVLVSRQSCLVDLTEHQLRFSGEGPQIWGQLMKPETLTGSVTVDWTDHRQQMLGWGGIATPTAYHQMSEKGKALWWKYLRQYNLLLHREYPNGQNLASDFSNWDQLKDATPHYYGDNFPNGEISDFEYIKKVQDLGGISIFEFWKFPSWVQDEAYILDIDAYCEAMLNYCRTAEEKTGKPPAIVGIQNEVRQQSDDWHAMTLALRNTLDENGYAGVKIHQQDMGRLARGILSAEVFSGDPDVWKTIDYAATHMYDYQNYFHDPDGYDSLLWRFKDIIGDKPFLSTELCINSPAFQAGSYRLAFTMAQLYHKNLSITNASSIMYCWILLNTVQPSYEASRSLFGVDKANGFIPYPSSFQLRTYGAYSRRIKRDMFRVGTVSSHKDLKVTAFSGEQGRTLVLLNRSQHAFQVELPEEASSLKFMERTSQYHQNEVEVFRNNMESGPGIEILPGEILTLSSVALN